MDIALTVTPSIVNPIEHDIDFDESGQIYLVDGAEAIAQHLRIRLQFFLGEYFLNKLEGIPYRRDIFVKIRNDTGVRAIFRKAISSTPGISRITEFDAELDRATRTLSVSFKAQTDSGDIINFPEFIVEV